MSRRYLVLAAMTVAVLVAGRPAFLVPGQTPPRWLHVGLAISIQEMRPLPF